MTMAIDTLRSAAHLQRELGDELFSALISSDNTAAVKKFLLGLQPSIPLLTLVGNVKIRLATNFVVGEFFKVNTKKNAPVKISYVGDNFKAWYLLPSVSEEAVPEDGPCRTPGAQHSAVETVLRYQALSRYSFDGPIITELGGEAKGETVLAEIFVLMAKQSNGEEGALLNSGYANIFYVRDVNLVLRAVSVNWNGGGWFVCAGSVKCPYGWLAGCRVFSRDS